MIVINYELLKLAKKNLKKSKAFYVKPESISHIIEDSKADVICLISTLEHLENPNLIVSLSISFP